MSSVFVMGMSLMLCFCGLFGLWGCGVGGVCLLHGWLTGFVLVGWLCGGVWLVCSGWVPFCAWLVGVPAFVGVLVGCVFLESF